MSELSSPQNLEEVCAYLELCVEEAKDKAWGEGISFALCFIKKLLLSAQPEREKGKWEITDLGAVGVFDSCSECNGVVKHKAPFYNFCPHCGADMRGKKNE